MVKEDIIFIGGELKWQPILIGFILALIIKSLSLPWSSEIVGLLLIGFIVGYLTKSTIGGLINATIAGTLGGIIGAIILTILGLLGGIIWFAVLGTIGFVTVIFYLIYYGIVMGIMGAVGGSLAEK